MPLQRTKEVKEAVVYPPSKRKPPPFKPQRPSKLPRTSTNDSEISDSNKDSEPAVSRTSSTGNARPVAAQPSTNKNSFVKATSVAVDLLSSSEDDKLDDSDDLPDNPLQTVTKKPAPAGSKATSAGKARTTTKETPVEPDALPPDIDQSATVPQRLLLRLMHESFKSQNTKIDKNATAMMQQYVDIFVREAVARAALSKKEDVDNGRATQSEENWLEQEDLEKVAGGMLMDF